MKFDQHYSNSYPIIPPPQFNIELLSRVLQIKMCTNVLLHFEYYTKKKENSVRKLPIVYLSVSIYILYFVNSKINISGFYLHINLWQPMCVECIAHDQRQQQAAHKILCECVWNKHREKSHWICFYFSFKRVRVYVYFMEILKLIRLVIFGLLVCCCYCFYCCLLNILINLGKIKKNVRLHSKYRIQITSVLMTSFFSICIYLCI